MTLGDKLGIRFLAGCGHRLLSNCPVRILREAASKRGEWMRRTHGWLYGSCGLGVSRLGWRRLLTVVRRA